MDKIISAISDFIAHCRFEKNLSSKTIKAYSIDLKQLQIFIGSNHNNFNSISEVDKYVLKNYLQHISKFKPKTINRKIATIKAMFNYLEYEDKILINPFRKMKVRIKEPRQLPKVMNLSEIKNIFRTVYNVQQSKIKNKNLPTSGNPIDIAVVELLFATGVRVSELSNLKEENIDLKNGCIKVMGKGSKERMIQICDKETLDALHNYYNRFCEKIKIADGYFFVNRLNKRLSEQSIRNIVKRHVKHSGINKNITPHTFRHSFATLLLEENVDIKYIQQLLGHSSIMTTQIYTHVNKEKQREILRLRHPRRRIRMQAFLVS